MKLRIMLQVGILFLLSVCAAQAATTLTVIGQHPFHKVPLTSVDDLRTMMETRQGEVVEGLQIAGYPQLSEPLIEQFTNARIETVRYEKGETFLWMFFKSYGKGKVKIVKDMTWGGKEPFTGYEFYVDLNGNRYTFVVPTVCGNLALKNFRKIAVESKLVPPPLAELPMMGETEVIIETPDDPFHFVADAGYLRMPDPADYVFGRVGAEYILNPQFSFLGMVGGAPKVSGADGTSAFLIDMLGQYNWSSVFVGLGLGGWITSGDSDIPSENSGVDLIGNVGVRILGEPDKFNTSLFMEARSGLDELDEIKDYGRFGAGLRFRL